MGCVLCKASYEYIEFPESGGHRVKRTKPAPRSPLEVSAKEYENVSDNAHELAIASSFMASEFRHSAVLDYDVPLEIDSDKLKINSSSSLSVLRGADGSLSLQSLPSPTASDISRFSSSTISSDLTQLPIGGQHIYDMITTTSGLTTQVSESLELDVDPDNDNDPEGVRTILCRSLTVDKNGPANSLPFVLFCYSQWAIVSVFEPRKVVHIMRDQVIAQFSSENTRTRAILIANVMDMFAKNLAVDGARRSILNRLASGVQTSGAAFMATPPSFVPAIDRQSAIRTLDSILEILTLQLDMQPLSDCVQTLETAAPVFRRACPDPPGRPVNIANVLLDLSLNLRYFPTIDIVKHLTTGLPTYFQYEVPFSLELCERIYQWQLQGNYGLQCLYGIPDQFILLFAWLNSLSESPGAGDNLQLTSWIEGILPQIEVAIDESGDPALRIGRMVVQEGWRFAVQIYFYMVLCKADAHDPRVIRAQKGFMRLLKSSKPGRNPDLFLVIAMVVVGVSTIKERDRETLRRRLLNLPECAEPGTAANETLLKLEDIWARTRREGRAALWSDLRTATFRLAGK